jgi:hypothetical protein
MFSFRHSMSAAVPILVLTAFAGACGGKDVETKDSGEAASPPEQAAEAEAPQSAQPAETPGQAVNAPLTRDDIARWEKGMDGELQAVREAAAKLKSARSSEDTLNAMMGVQEMATLEAGAKAAGLDPERYKFVRSNLSAVVGYLTPQLGGIDTTMLSPAQREELRQTNQAQIERMQQEVPPEVVAALKPRARELRKKDMELVGARLKGAGM